jgi:hypothetical protein
MGLSGTLARSHAMGFSLHMARSFGWVVFSFLARSRTEGFSSHMARSGRMGCSFRVARSASMVDSGTWARS